jgi:hypothetical protein
VSLVQWLLALAVATVVGIGAFAALAWWVLAS